MPLLTVFLSAGAQVELQQIHRDFLAHYDSLDKNVPDMADITVLHESDIKALCGKDTDPEAVVKALENFIDSKKPKAPKKPKGRKRRVSMEDETPLKVILLSAFPDTVEQFRAIVESSSQYPVLDSVVRLVMRPPGEDLVNSDMGPETTMKLDFEKLKVEASGSVSELKSLSNKSNLVADLDIDEFLLSTRDFHGGSVTVDDLNCFCMADEAEDEDNFTLVPRPMEDIFADFLHLCKTLGNLKEKFHEWASETRTINVKFDAKAVKRARAATSTLVQDGGAWLKEPLYNAYQGYVNLLPGDCQSAGGVLYSMVQSIVYTSFDRDNKADVFNCVDFASYDFNNVQLPGQNDMTQQSFDRNGSSSALLEGVMRHALLEDNASTAGGSNLIMVEEGDSNAYRAIYASRYLSDASDPSKSVVNATGPVTNESLATLDEGSLSLPTQNACAGLIQFENEAIYRAQVPRLLGQGGLPLTPTIASIDRSIQESELLTFSSFSAPDIHRFNMLRIFDEMLQNSIPRLANFTGQQIGAIIDDVSITKRKYFRHISGFALPQILARDLDTEPVLIRQYYPLTDQLLLGVLWIPPNRRMGIKDWNPNKSMHTKPTFEQYMVMKERQNFTPRTLGVLRTSINVSKGQMDKYRQDTCIITPSDKSMVTTKHLNSTSQSWLSVHLDNSMFGLRLTPKLANKGGGGGPGGGGGLKRAASHAESPKSEEGARDFKRMQSQQIVSGRVDAAETDYSDNNSLTSLISNVPTQDKGYFVCHTEDNVRITASVLSKSGELRKPDGKCFVNMKMTFINGMVCSFSSDGVISFMSAPALQTPKTTHIEANAAIRRPYGFETSRHMVSGGVVTRHMDKNYLYSRDILLPDGTRILIRGEEVPPDPLSKMNIKNSKNTKKNTKTKKGGKDKGGLVGKKVAGAGGSEAKEKVCPDPFLQHLFQTAPTDWRYVRLDVNGDVCYYNGEPGLEEDTDDNERLVSDAGPVNIRTSTIDAETRSEVFEYKDGRIVTLWADDDLREARFPDGTRSITHLKTNAVFVEKASLPSIEYDVSVDQVSKKHSLGLQVPIAKGGERTRCRVAMPDGTAVFIKYNTKITAKYNGSIKLVRRNHEMVVVEDGGIVSYSPASSWSNVNEKEFATDSYDEAISRVDQYKSRQNTMNSPLPSRGKKKTRFKTKGPNSPDAQSRASTAMTNATHMTNTTVGSRKSGKSGGAASNSVPGGAPRSDLSSVTSKGGGGDAFFTGPGGGSGVGGGASIQQDMQSIGTIDSLVKQQAAQNGTTYIFNVQFMTCMIKDHENNVFDLDLSRPMEPHLHLAGEIEGMKPKAISESTTEPRMFVVNRDGNATEVVRNESLEALETAISTTPDLSKDVTAAEHLACDLGNTRSHAYYLNQRSASEGGIPFQEIFGQRYWHNYAPPTAAAIQINKMENARLSATNLVTIPKIFQTQVMTEYSPLSQEGYAQLAADMASWQSWRAKRVQVMDRYAFVDPRTPQDMEQEKEMSTKVKKAYKAARNKAAALRKKEREREKLLQTAEMSCVQEDIEEETFSSDEEEEYADDPETLEIVEAFNTYSVDYDVLQGSELRIPLEDCRPALVQILNRFVSHDDISNALKDSSVTSLNLERFRRLYFIIKNPGTGSQVSISDSENGQLRRATLTTSVPMLSTSLSMSLRLEKLEDCEDKEDNESLTGSVEGKSAAGSAVQAARLAKTCAQ